MLFVRCGFDLLLILHCKPHAENGMRHTAQLLCGGLREGDYVMRISDSAPGPNGAAYGIAVATGGAIQHYKIEKHLSGQLSKPGAPRYKFGIQDGLRWEFVVELIDHYHQEVDGLCCMLTRNVSLTATEISVRELDVEVDLLGSGEFGEVRKALWRKKGIAVAVKVLKQAGGGAAAEAETQAFIDEGKTMIGLNHPNVVELLGVVSKGQKMLVTEFCQFGALQKHLKSRQKAGEALRLDVQLSFCRQIAEGMVYLEGKNVVHRDLAARNVLVSGETTVKISDFGMSRKVEDYYKSTRAGKWPLKWYAPECMYYSKFTSKGDVWSFGVCCWEVLSHGKKPFKGMKGEQVVQYVIVDKGRLACPPNCPDSMYDLMQTCWTHEMKERPDFVFVAKEMKRVAAASRGGGVAPPVSRSRVLDDQRFYDVQAAMDELQVAEDEEQSIYMRHASSIKQTQLKIKCSIPESSLKMEREVGKGSVGNVIKATFASQKGSIPVVVKIVRVGDDYKHTSFLTHADMMAGLKHAHLVPFHGLCLFRDGRMGCVLEHQPLGALNEYLQSNKPPTSQSKRFITQIAMGMQYLESKRVVHRDLGARNVLVFNPKHCKVSDFSLARALGHETEYYRTEQRGLWPIKWYAPECLYSGTFTTYSDVWSFGVTMWEVAMDGKKPYPGMRGRQVLEFIEKGARLKIPPKIHGVEPWIQPLLEKCWNANPRARPNFKELAALCAKHAPP
jgi:serine/threonine protein kinase